MRAISPGGAAAFESYLFYHDLIHGISLILLAVILLGKIAYALPWAGMDALAVYKTDPFCAYLTVKMQWPS